MPEPASGKPLGPDWFIERQSADELVLGHRNPDGWRRVGGALVVSLGALALAVTLLLATPEDARLISGPVALLLLVVAALGLPAAVRNLQRQRRGVRLRFSKDGVEGWPIAALAWRPRTVPADQVAQVQVNVFPHPPLSLVLLEVTLKDGTRLSGPELAVPTGSPHPLDPVAETARRLIGAHSAR